MYVLNMAVARYGTGEYPLSGFPEFYNEEAVCEKIREYFPNDSRAPHCQVIHVGPWPEVGMPETIVIRFPDNSVEVRYERLEEQTEAPLDGANRIESMGRSGEDGPACYWL